MPIITIKPDAYIMVRSSFYLFAKTSYIVLLIFYLDALLWLRDLEDNLAVRPRRKSYSLES